MLRNQLSGQGLDIKWIVYPGHGLRTVEVVELRSVLRTFGSEVDLQTYEEVWP